MSPAPQNDSQGSDLLEEILKVYGTIDEADLSFLSHQAVADQVLHETQNENKSKVDFKKMFPKTDDGIINILQQLLEFNPYFRPKPEELLKAPIFDELRKEFPEYLIPPPNLI